MVSVSLSLSPDHSKQAPVTLSECSLPPGSELFLLGALVPLGAWGVFYGGQ